MKETRPKIIPPAERKNALSALRSRKMATSPHAYVRGNTVRFYTWLEQVAPNSLPEGPPIWICGDCHIGNLGPIANAEGDIEVQIRDFDQTVIGNPAHDLIRLGLSLASAMRSSNLPGAMTSRMLEQLVDGYIGAFEEADNCVESVLKPKAIKIVMKKAMQRSWKELARERAEGDTVRLPLGRRFWPLSSEECEAIAEITHMPSTRELVTSIKHRDEDARIKMLDAAYWVKGCSSLGYGRYAVLMDVGNQARRQRDFCLIDIKEAVKPTAPHARTSGMPKNNAERVVAGARQLSPNLGERMATARLLHKTVFIRELLPQDLKLELDTLGEAEARLVALYLATVVGKAHARQMDETTRRSWQAELRRNCSKSLEVPSWLWTSVVELLGNHEIGYLEHCRHQAANDRRRRGS